MLMHTDFKHLIDASPTAFAILHLPDWVFVEANEAFLELLGYSRHELIGHSSDELMLKLGDHPHQFIQEYRCKSGRIGSALFSTERIEVNDEPHFRVALTDISALTATQRDLIEVELHYTLAFEHLLTGFVYGRLLFKDGQPQDFIYLLVNQAFEERTGLSSVVGRKVSDVIPGLGQSNPEIFEILGRVAQGAPAEHFETCIEALQRRYSISVCSPKPGHFIALFDDITERKRIEESLREQKEFFCLIAENVGDYIAVLDPEGRRLYNSPSYQKLFPTRNLVGSDSFADIHPSDQERVRQVFRETVHSGVGRQIDFCFQMPDGSVRDMESRGNVIKDKAGQVTRVVVVSHDITAHKQAEAALRESEAFGLSILDAVSANIAVLDGEGLIVMVNEPWRRFAVDNGFEPGAPAPNTGVGVNYLAFCRAGIGSAADGESVQAGQGIQAVLDGRLPGFSMEYPCHSPDQQRWFSMRVSPLGSGQQGVVVAHVNITENKLTERALAESRERLSLMLRGTQDGFWDWDLVRGELYYSSRWWTMLGYAQGELSADPALWLRLMHPDDQERVQKALAAALAAGTTAYEIEFRLRHKAGHYLHIMARALIVYDAQGKALRIAGANTDISERKQLEEALRVQLERNQRYLDTTSALMVELDSVGVITMINPALEHLLGYAKDELLGRNWIATCVQQPESKDDQPLVLRRNVEGNLNPFGEFENILVSRNGRLHAVAWCNTYRVDSAGHILGTFSSGVDITERRRMEDQVRYLAFFDQLTRIPNRRLFEDRLRQAMAASKRSGCFGVVMFLDLDNFKLLNDTYGHEYGDLLLIEAADRLTKCVREKDTVARFGGDEFVVMIGELDVDKDKSIKEARVIAEKILVALGEIYLLKLPNDGAVEIPVAHHCTVSIGACLFVDHVASRNEILKSADSAMYRAKWAGGNRIHFFESSSNE